MKRTVVKNGIMTPFYWNIKPQPSGMYVFHHFSNFFAIAYFSTWENLLLFGAFVRVKKLMLRSIQSILI